MVECLGKRELRMEANTKFSETMSRKDAKKGVPFSCSTMSFVEQESTERTEKDKTLFPLFSPVQTEFRDPVILQLPVACRFFICVHRRFPFFRAL